MRGEYIPAVPDSEAKRLVVATDSYEEAVIMKSFLAEGFKVLERRTELPGGLTADEVAERRAVFESSRIFNTDHQDLPQYELSDAKIAFAGASSYVRQAASRLVRGSKLRSPKALEAQMRRRQAYKQLGRILMPDKVPQPEDIERGDDAASQVV